MLTQRVTCSRSLGFTLTLSIPATIHPCHGRKSEEFHAGTMNSPVSAELKRGWPENLAALAPEHAPAHQSLRHEHACNQQSTGSDAESAHWIPSRSRRRVRPKCLRKVIVLPHHSVRADRARARTRSHLFVSQRGTRLSVRSVQRTIERLRVHVGQRSGSRRIRSGVTRLRPSRSVSARTSRRSPTCSGTRT
jgi:hypothetical protein